MTETSLAAIGENHTRMLMHLKENGAETEEQAAFLRANGCDYIQGYYYYKPMPEAEFLQLLEEGK